jgi:hypothetical protein
MVATLVLADEDEGAGGDMHYVTVEQDRTKVQKVVCMLVLTKASPGLTFTYVLLLKFLMFSLELLCAFTFKS